MEGRASAKMSAIAKGSEKEPGERRSTVGSARLLDFPGGGSEPGRSGNRRPSHDLKGFYSTDTHGWWVTSMPQIAGGPGLAVRSVIAARGGHSASDHEQLLLLCGHHR